MIGLTDTEFESGADCYIVVFTPIPGQEVIEFLRGIVTEMGGLIPTSRVIHQHPQHTLLRYLEHRLGHIPDQLDVREIKAVVTDPNAYKIQGNIKRSPIDPVYFQHPHDPSQLHEPLRDYLVVHPDECVRYLKAHLGQTQQALGCAYERVRSLETVLRNR